MKTLRRIGLAFLALIILLSAYILITGKTYVFRAIWYNFAAISDYKHFSNDTVVTAAPQPWPLSRGYNQLPYPDSLASELNFLGSVGLVMIENDSIRFERYWDGYSDSSISGSFSMAKSIVSLLVGVALREGKIGSLDDPAGKYIPEFNEGEKAQVTIKDLLTMSSGSDFDESYWNPFSITAELYYGADLYKTATMVHIVHPPGTIHKYKSGDTQLLGIILQKVYGQNLAALASEKLWQTMGAEHPALWSTDHSGGYEKAYCCFNSNTRDFARLGKLMLDSGKWNGIPIIDSAYWAASIHPCGIPEPSGEPCDYYGYQWWLDPLHPGVFYARGILGQYIIVIPSRKRIIVRLGKMTSPIRVHTVPKEVRYLIEWGLRT